MPKTKVFVSEHCAPCQEVKKLIQEKHLEEEIELVDVNTDEGFALFYQMVLSKRDGAVPSAFKDGQECKILVGGDEVIKIECPPPPPQEP